MKSNPEKILHLPVYCEEWQTIRANKIGEFGVPLLARLDLDDVFNGTSVCLLDYLSTADEGNCAIVEEAIYIMKKSAKSTTSGWMCEYFNKCRIAKLAESNADDGLSRPPRQRERDCLSIVQELCENLLIHPRRTTLLIASIH